MVKQIKISAATTFSSHSYFDFLEYMEVVVKKTFSYFMCNIYSCICTLYSCICTLYSRICTLYSCKV